MLRLVPLWATLFWFFLQLAAVQLLHGERPRESNDDALALNHKEALPQLQKDLQALTARVMEIDRINGDIARKANYNLKGEDESQYKSNMLEKQLLQMRIHDVNYKIQRAEAQEQASGRTSQALSSQTVSSSPSQRTVSSQSMSSPPRPPVTTQQRTVGSSSETEQQRLQGEINEMQRQQELLKQKGGALDSYEQQKMKFYELMISLKQNDLKQMRAGTSTPQQLPVSQVRTSAPQRTMSSSSLDSALSSLPSIGSSTMSSPQGPFLPAGPHEIGGANFFVPRNPGYVPEPKLAEKHKIEPSLVYKFHEARPFQNWYNDTNNPNPSLNHIQSTEFEKGPWHELKVRKIDYLKKSRELLAKMHETFTDHRDEERDTHRDRDGNLVHLSKMPYVPLAEMEKYRKAWSDLQMLQNHTVWDLQDLADRVMQHMKKHSQTLKEWDRDNVENPIRSEAQRLWPN